MMTALFAALVLSAAPVSIDSSLREAAVRRLQAQSPEGRFVRGPQGEVRVGTQLRIETAEADPELAARTFLADHAAALGVGASDNLVLRKGLPRGEAGSLVFERTVR